MSSTTRFAGLNTPRLILDADRLARNAARMRARCDALGVMLRPHLKTAKSTDVALVAASGERGPITVSTLAEAEYFAAAGWRDILYTTTIAPAKLARAHHIQREHGARLLLVLDDRQTAAALGQAAAALGARFGVLIEVDCGEHRSGTDGQFHGQANSRNGNRYHEGSQQIDGQDRCLGGFPILNKSMRHCDQQGRAEQRAPDTKHQLGDDEQEGKTAEIARGEEPEQRQRQQELGTGRSNRPCRSQCISPDAFHPLVAD